MTKQSPIKIKKPVPAYYFKLWLTVAALSSALMFDYNMNIAINFLGFEAAVPGSNYAFFLALTAAITLIISIICCLITKFNSSTKLISEIYQLVHDYSHSKERQVAIDYLKTAIAQRGGERFCSLDMHNVSEYLNEVELSKRRKMFSKLLHLDESK